MRMKICAAMVLLNFCLSLSILAQSGSGKLSISHLVGDYYIFTTYNLYKGIPVSANGMYVTTEDGVAMLDTPWDTTQFQPLLDSIEIRHHKKVILCIATHSHADRTAGLEYYLNIGIKTYTSAQTDSICALRGEKRAEFLFYSDTAFTIGQYTFQTFYPGPGHTADNIVLWFGNDKILYGGCLVKSKEAADLGYTGEANIPEWSNTIRKIQNKFPDPNYIIPGHQSWASRKALQHTLMLLKKQGHAKAYRNVDWVR